jgi:signal transduction histidine kinase
LTPQFANGLVEEVILVKRVAPISVAAVSLSVLFLVAALVQEAIFYHDFSPFADFGTIFLVLLTASALLSLSMFLIADVRIFRVLLFTRSITLLLLAYGFGTNLWMNLTLAFPLIFEMCIYEDYPRNLVLSSIYVVVSILYKLSLFLDGASNETLRDCLLYVLFLESFALAGSLLTRYRQEAIRYKEESIVLDKAVANLSDASNGYLRFAHEAEARSTRNERKRITQELHDSIGHTLTNLVMIVEAAKALVSVDHIRLRELLTTAADQAQQGLAETRRSLYALRRQRVFEPAGLSCIHELTKTFQESTGVNVRVEYANLPFSCGVEVDDFIYRFIQEGLTNSFRHGRATNIEVLLWKDDEKITVTLRDNGRGCESIEEGIGILGMRERLGKFGGTLEFHNPAYGFEMCAEIPMRS